MKTVVNSARMRWGMGVDGSETRLCEYRCQALLDADLGDVQTGEA
jgi:hypothetical protein